MPQAEGSDAPVVVWLRRDLRLTDNPALCAAASTAHPVVPLFVLDDDTPGPWRAGGAARWWLDANLRSLARAFEALGSGLVLRRGRAARVVPELCRSLGATAVHWNRCYEPYATSRDAGIKAALYDAGIDAVSHRGSLLFEPWDVATKAGSAFRVFSPFWRACLAAPPPQRPLPRVATLPAPSRWPASDDLGHWRLAPSQPDWADGLRAHWVPGEQGAMQCLNEFLNSSRQSYDTVRDFPARRGTSRLSPYLQVGAIGPRQIWHAVLDAGGKPGREDGPGAFLKELGWREFSYHLLFHNPRMPTENLATAFDAMPWRQDPDGLRRWQHGRTGYPIVDAGMHELWRTGWMHNRVRMLVASFLTKHLLIDWREGARWFWETLVDADLASNSVSWQWVAGCGADAAPYHRIFNPIVQGERFDPEGTYVRRWVPELAAMPAETIYRPWQATPEILATAGVVLDSSYPGPMIDHKAARARALAAFRDHIRRHSETE